MTGPEHYAEAERLLRSALTPHEASMNGFDGWARDDLAAHAQAHATLALAAATADMGTAQGRDETIGPWARVTA